MPRYETIDTTTGKVVESRDEPDPPELARALAIRDGVGQALAGLQTIIDGPATMTAAQLTTAVKAEARVLRRLVRLAANLLDGTD